MRQVPPTRDGFDARENLPRCSECHAIVSRCIVSTEGGLRHARPHSIRGVSHGDRRDRPDLRLHRAGPRQGDNGGFGPPHALAVLTLVALAVGRGAAWSHVFGSACWYMHGWSARSTSI